MILKKFVCLLFRTDNRERQRLVACCFVQTIENDFVQAACCFVQVLWLAVRDKLPFAEAKAIWLGLNDGDAVDPGLAVGNEGIWKWRDTSTSAVGSNAWERQLNGRVYQNWEDFAPKLGFESGARVEQKDYAVMWVQTDDARDPSGNFEGQPPRPPGTWTDMVDSSQNAMQIATLCCKRTPFVQFAWRWGVGYLEIRARELASNYWGGPNRVVTTTTTTTTTSTTTTTTTTITGDTGWYAEGSLPPWLTVVDVGFWSGEFLEKMLCA